MKLRTQHGLLLVAAVAISTAVTWHKYNLAASTLRLDPVVTLASCSPIDERYTRLFFSDLLLDKWPENYHNTVERILDEYTKPIEKIACLENDIFPVEEDDALYELASKLPPWSTPEKLADLQRNDVGFVLLEFLRIYECALLDRKNFAELYVNDKYAQDQDEGRVRSDLDLRLGTQRARIDAERSVVAQELAIARPTLEKALLVISGNNRLSVLDAELQCLQRASLDIRNALSLAADTSSCLPRIWNTKDVLRNLVP